MVGGAFVVGVNILDFSIVCMLCMYDVCGVQLELLENDGNHCVEANREHTKKSRLDSSNSDRCMRW